MKIQTFTTSITTVAVAAAFLAIPAKSQSQDFRFSQFKRDGQSFRGNDNSQSNDSKRDHSHTNQSSNRTNNNNSNKVFSAQNLQKFATEIKKEYEKKEAYQPRDRYQPKEPDYQRFQPKEQDHKHTQPDSNVQIPTKNWRPEDRHKHIEKPIETKPTAPYQSSGNKAVDVGKMVSILKGKPLPAKPGVVSKTPEIQKPNVVDRVVPVNPNALPKGMGTYSYMKKGKTPAEGLADPSGGGTSTLYMKKGKDHAHGEAEPGAPVVVRIKDGRPSAESDGHHDHNHGSPGSYGGGSVHNLSNHGSGGNNGYPAASAPSLAYRVDSSSQLATNSVKFRKGSTELADAASYYYLQNLASALRDPSLANDRFVVEGHASAEGSTTANLILSQERANAIFDYLIAQGIPTNRLLSVGHGEFQARYAATDPEYLRAQDRQVIVFKLAE